MCCSAIPGRVEDEEDTAMDVLEAELDLWGAPAAFEAALGQVGWAWVGVRT